MIVIQASYRGGEYTFFFSRKGSVYLNIRGEGSVIQASLRGGKCNLLKIKIIFIRFFRNNNIHSLKLVKHIIFLEIIIFIH